MNPIRGATASSSLFYNPTTFEITQGSSGINCSTVIGTSTIYFTGTINNTDGPINTLYIDTNNLYYLSGTLHSGAFSSSSDYRIKENIKFLDPTIYNVDNLKPVIYNHKDTKKTNIGFLAHEVQEHYPFLVSGIKDGPETQSINYIGLIGVLTKEIQELKKDNEIIKTKLSNLSNRINKIE